MVEINQYTQEETELLPAVTTRLDVFSHWLREKVNSIEPLQKSANWARKNSLFQYPFITACCAMEYMAAMGPRFDLARFGAEYPRFSPRQADMIIIVGTVTQKQAPVLRRVYESMSSPKWVVSFGVCASSGGFYDNYATVAGIDRIIPVDVYIPGCPPTPEQFLDGIILLQEKITKERQSLTL